MGAILCEQAIDQVGLDEPADVVATWADIGKADRPLLRLGGGGWSIGDGRSGVGRGATIG
jgi:hypothetical protein